MSLAVRFDEYGGVDVFHVVEVDEPQPGAGEVRVRVKAAGINPGEAKIREGPGQSLALDLPVGPGERPGGRGGCDRRRCRWRGLGDEVIGFTDERASQAELVVVPAGNLTPRPPSVAVGGRRRLVRGRQPPRTRRSARSA